MSGRRHNLKEIFGQLDDEQIIEDLKSTTTLRDLAKKTIGHGRETYEQEFHGAYLYYFKTHRPEILQRMNDDAVALAAGWPANWAHIGALDCAGTYWFRAVKRRFRALIRKRFYVSGTGTPEDPWESAPVETWLETLWPYVLEIHDRLGLPFTLPEVEKTLYKRLFVPTSIYRYEFREEGRMEPTRPRAGGNGGGRMILKEEVGWESLVGEFRKAFRKKATAERKLRSPSQAAAPKRPRGRPKGSVSKGKRRKKAG